MEAWNPACFWSNLPNRGPFGSRKDPGGSVRATSTRFFLLQSPETERGFQFCKRGRLGNAQTRRSFNYAKTAATGLRPGVNPSRMFDGHGLCARGSGCSPYSGIALMVWLYWAGFPMLVGAELNGVLAKRLKQTP